MAITWAADRGKKHHVITLDGTTRQLDRNSASVAFSVTCRDVTCPKFYPLSKIINAQEVFASKNYAPNFTKLTFSVHPIAAYSPDSY